MNECPVPRCPTLRDARLEEVGAVFSVPHPGSQLEFLVLRVVFVARLRHGVEVLTYVFVHARPRVVAPTAAVPYRLAHDLASTAPGPDVVAPVAVLVRSPMA
jgi:hypothetical protein